MTSQPDLLRRIEELRSELHRRMGGGYDPEQVARLVPISQELDKLVVEVTRRQWSGAGAPALPGRHGEPQGDSRRWRKKR